MAFGGLVQQLKGRPTGCPGQNEIGNVLGFLDLVLGGPSHGIGLGEIDAFITVKALER
jgi:hypothetical protein